MAEENKILNKQLLKKWWFWVIIVAILGLIGLLTQDTPATNETTTKENTTSTQNTGTLPIISKADYIEKEGLVSFKEIKEKGYKVTAKYVNEAVPATNQEFTEQFTSADINSCSDRLGFDAYTVSDITQDGDNITITLTSTPNSNQTCPAGTNNDL